MALDDAARIVLHGLLDAVFGAAPAVLRDDDVDAVHDMRVAIRRLRSALDTFEDALPRRLAEPHVRAMRRLGRRLGRVRDADVHIGALHDALATAHPAEKPGLLFVLETLAARRRRDLSRFSSALSQVDRAGFELVLGARNPTIRLIGPDLGDHARKTLCKHLRRVIRRGDRTVRSGDAEALHALRIAEKRLRYNLEFFAPLLATEADHALEMLTELQDCLGAIADADAFTGDYDEVLARLGDDDPRCLGIGARITANAKRRDDALEALRELWDSGQKKSCAGKLEAAVLAALEAL